MPENQKVIALIGWSIPSIEAADKLNRPFVVVSFPEFGEYAKKYDIPFIGWDFGKNITHEEIYKHSEELSRQLNESHVDVAIPLFEETVEWAGALNAHLKKDPRKFNHSLLFRNKARMKRRAQIGGLKVSVFEEGFNKEDARQFLKRVNDVLLKGEQEENDPIHVKPLDKAGAAGHRVIRTEADIENILTDDQFPLLMESHLDGVEISCEAFIRNRKLEFLNITEYVVFGYAMMAPPSPEIEAHRPLVRKAIEQLIDAFDIEYGMIHPEFFLNEQGELSFVEVAYRIPGGHIFELMQRTYDFDPFQAHILCCDPNTTDEEIHGFFPDETKANGHAASFDLYPRVEYVQGFNMPRELEEHPCFERHSIYNPELGKVQEHDGYGNNYSTIFFYGDDHEQVKQPLMDYVDHDFYI
jgi:hypothetical protein